MRASLHLGLLLFLTSCGDEPTRDIFLVEGVVLGQVTHHDAPVGGAWVALDGLYPLSNGVTMGVYDSVRTDVAGQYLGRLALMNMADTIVTFAIRVWPPIGSGLAPAEITGLNIRVTEEPAQDTLAMNVARAVGISGRLSPRTGRGCGGDDGGSEIPSIRLGGRGSAHGVG